MPYVLNVWMYECCSEVDSTIDECVDNVILRIFNWKVVGINFKYEKFMAGVFSKPTIEEVQRLDLPMINDVELNVDESSFLHDTSPDRSGKRHAINIHTHSYNDHQGFEDFSTFPLPKILRRTCLSIGTSATQPTKKRRIDHDVQCSQKEDVPSKKHVVEMDFLPTEKDKGKVVFDDIDKSLDIEFADDIREDAIVERIHIPVQKQTENLEELSIDVGTSILNALVEEMVNQESEDIETATLDALVDTDVYLSTISESAQEEIDAILQGLAALVDDISLEFVKPLDETINMHSLSDSQIPSNFSDVVVATHQAVKISDKRTRTKSKVFKSPYMIEYASGSKDLEDKSTYLK
ncbi:hypothetical protein FXO37_16306 [Capsicum annuum]|nr:hypothetical protein FXO37_16306 [Capsicum annuum]